MIEESKQKGGIRNKWECDIELLLKQIIDRLEMLENKTEQPKYTENIVIGESKIVVFKPESILSSVDIGKEKFSRIDIFKLIDYLELQGFSSKHLNELKSENERLRKLTEKVEMEIEN